ncbi:MAG: 50S ribosomal protein L11 methyltransferase [Anaerolineales bacterium]
MTKSWLRISIEVDPELAESVSEVFARYIPSGVVIESTAVYADAEDEGHAVGPLRVMGYIPVDEQLEERRAQIEQGLRYLALIQPVPGPSYETIQDQNWMEAWKQHYKPLTVGERLLILPAWMPQPAGDRVAVLIEPGMAFGTGVHPTTQLSLQLVEKHMDGVQSVIDVGCGSAILAIAAAKLGADRVVAVDIDPVALDNARLNAKLNGVEIEIGEGSVAELLAGKFALQQADLVLANILAPVLVRLLDAGMALLLNPGGTLIFSGILAEQEADMRAAIEKAGLRVIAERRILDWLALAAKKI